MADIDYDDYGVSPRIMAGQAQRMVHLAGAVCSLALIAGVGMWGYKLAVRDVSGVPVIRAAEGPMRVAPSNPGGNVADHQGMAVNVIAAAGGAAGMPAQVMLAPAPMDLAAEDAPGLSSLEAEAESAAPPVTVAAVPRAVDPQSSDLDVMALDAPGALILPPEPVQDAAPISTEDAVAMALAEALGDAMPLTALTALADPEPEAQTSSVAAVPGSVRPRTRPQRALDGVSDVQPVSASAPTGPEIDPATLAVGTRLVQLGAFDNPEIARSEWVKLGGRFGDLMTGKTLVVQSAQSGGRTFYRLRAHGFGGEDDARRFCAALLAEGAACIPVAHR
ncbi:MAG: SPOR domain-containing protein [Pseudotabrizicola sp.]|uniref:SPOR domain-containing protein n=1 Tax=Pseudotabrizicola sp. TaxID=2939647 RepID=UPI00272F9D7D|nr:SPOR domain-containing protein [Pseudotabrizicola sp.]MDP2083186.1 SPOR domain-containing protein [Pseudotabrizicola sp.]MDZ7572603.1 SPOR domain-containing protein [Pseudotabrizicola sp.]